ncbi:hypothetical protein ACP275_11G082500 [Erythranthe tilingii]
MDEYDYEFYEFLTYGLIKAEFTSIHDNSPPQSIEINFKYLYEIQTSEYIQCENEDEPQFVSQFNDPVIDYLVRVRGHQFSSFNETRNYMEEELKGLPLSIDNRRKLVNYSLHEARKSILPEPVGGPQLILNIHMCVSIDHDYIFYNRENNNYESMNNCSICLENFSGGDGGDYNKEAALSMPCSHIFHGDCIKTWLMTSHYCPLCQFEMPTS